MHRYPELLKELGAEYEGIHLAVLRNRKACSDLRGEIASFRMALLRTLENKHAQEGVCKQLEKTAQNQTFCAENAGVG